MWFIFPTFNVSTWVAYYLYAVEIICSFRNGFGLFCIGSRQVLHPGNHQQFSRRWLQFVDVNSSPFVIITVRINVAVVSLMVPDLLSYLQRKCCKIRCCLKRISSNLTVNTTARNSCLFCRDNRRVPLAVFSYFIMCDGKLLVINVSRNTLQEHQIILKNVTLSKVPTFAFILVVHENFFILF